MAHVQLNLTPPAAVGGGGSGHTIGTSVGINPNSGDVTSALQAALTAIAGGTNNASEGASTQGNVLELVAGEYLISATIVIPAGVILRGQGPQSTRIWASASWNSTTYPWMVQLGNRWNGSPNIAFGTRIEDIEVSNSRGIANLTPIYSEIAQELSGIHQVFIFAPTKYGIWLNGSLGGATNMPAHVNIEHVNIYPINGCIAGVYLQQAGTININVLSDVSIVLPANPHYGIYIDGNSDALIDNIHCESAFANVTYGVYNAGQSTIRNVQVGNMGAGSCAVGIDQFSGGTTCIDIYNSDPSGEYTIKDNIKGVTIASQNRVTAYFSGQYGTADSQMTVTGVPGFLGDTFVANSITYTSNASLANITGLGTGSQWLKAGSTYQFELELFITAGIAAGGINVDFNGGSATMTAFHASIAINGGATVIANTNTTALATGVNSGATTAPTEVSAVGAFTVNAQGTFIPRAAQNASNGTGTTIAAGSYLKLRRLSV